MGEIINAFSTQPAASIATTILIIFMIYGMVRFIGDIHNFFLNKDEKKHQERIESNNERDSLLGYEPTQYFGFGRSQYESDLLNTSVIIYSGSDDRSINDSIEDAERLIESVHSLLDERMKESEKKLSAMFGNVSKEDKIENVRVSTGKD